MDREERETLFTELVNDPNIESRAWQLAGELAVEGDPPVHRHDLVAARPYLRTCISRMSDTEAYQLTNDHAAGLWARGALGQARFRAEGSAQSSARRRR